MKKPIELHRPWLNAPTEINSLLIDVMLIVQAYSTDNEKKTLIIKIMKLSIHTKRMNLIHIIIIEWRQKSYIFTPLLTNSNEYSLAIYE